MKTTKTLLATCLSAAALLFSPVYAQSVIRISTAAPESSSLSTALRSIKTDMETKFPGAITMSVHAQGSLFRQGTEIAAMQRGNLEMATPVTFEIEQQLPEYSVLGAAYLFRDPQHMVNTFRGPVGQEFAADVLKKMDIVLLDTAYLGTRTVNLRMDKDVKVPSDLKGVKMRMPPGPAFQALARALGANAVSMPITEVYLALKTGSIDAQENPPNMTRDWKFDEVTKTVALTNHTISPVFIAISKKAYDKLSAAQQTELKAAARTAADIQIAQTIKEEKDAVEHFRKNGIRIAQPDIAAFRTQVMAEYERSGLTKDWKPGLLERVNAVN